MSTDLQRAIDNFSDALSPTDKQALGTQAPTHDDVLTLTQHIDALGAKKKVRSLGRRFQPFLEFIQQFSSVIGQFIQSNPRIAALVWGGLKAVITVLYNFHDYFEKISTMFLKLGSICPRLDRLQKLFPSSVKLKEATCAFFATVVEFCTRVLDFLKSPSLVQLGRTVWKSFKAEFNDIESRLIQQRDDIDLEVTITSEEEARKERQEAVLYRRRGDAHRAFEVKRLNDMRERNEIQERKAQRKNHLEKITSYDHTSVFLRLKEKRMGESPSAASWFTDDQRFTGWVSAKSSAFWCHGIPGSGKSVLTTSVLDHLFEARTSDTTICYFFCSYSEPESLEQHTIVASLLKQILIVQDLWSQNTMRMVDTMCSGPIAKPSLPQLVSLLQKMIDEQKKIYVLIDGLDECSGVVQTGILSLFKNILRKCPGTNFVKAYFSSRTDLEVGKAISECVNFNIDQVTNRSDIRGYIERKLEEAIEMHQLVKLCQSTMDDIKEALEKGSEGMFLWVDFQIQDICRQDNEDNIRDLINSLPRGLDETYCRILERITREKIPNLAFQIFTWIAGARRPLTLGELAEAVALRSSFKSYSEARISQDHIKMIHNCGNLVVVSALDQTVQFAHSTVRKFLTDVESPLNLNTVRVPVPILPDGTFWQDLIQIDQTLGMVCLSYLMFSDFETQLTKRDDNNLAVRNSMLEITNLGRFVPLVLGTNSSIRSLFNFAANFIPFLSSKQQKEHGYQFTLQREDLYSSLRANYHLLDYVSENWIWHCKHLNDDESDNNTTIRQAFRLFKCIVAGEGPSFLISPCGVFFSERGGDLCKYSLEEGKEALLKIFLSHAKDSERFVFQNRRFGYLMMDAFHIACCYGHEGIVNLLLANGFIPNSKDTNSRTPLFWAAVEGHEAVVKLLLTAKGVDPDSKDRFDRTPLCWAAANGHEAVVKLLLTAKGVDPDSKDRFDRTPLSMAAANGHKAVVKLLLDIKGVDPDSKDKDAQTPLSRAAEEGHEAVVKLLLAVKRVDPDSKDAYRQTPLSWAAQGGHEAVVRLLLAINGVDPDSKDNCGRTPLSRAAVNGHEAVVKLLLDVKGVDPDSQDNQHGQTPLFRAAVNGHVGVVKLLLTVKGADPHIKTFTGQTPLSRAAQGGHEAVVRLLLAINGVDPDSKDRFGRTPLCWAAVNGHEAVVKLLLGIKGVDPDSKGIDGGTPLDWATKRRHEAVVKLLQSRVTTI